MNARRRVSAGRGQPTPVALGMRIRRLFVANRGEIAARIARTCRRLGIEAVIPFVDDGRPLPSGSPPGEPLDLLDPARVVAAARAAGADALHPGYGFLAENADFARLVRQAGLVWVGPPPEAIAAMGDKVRARELARQLGVPIPEGGAPADQSDAGLLAAAERLGLPLIVKPAAGGGGKGMRVVRRPETLVDAIAAARREARAAFGDDRLLLERYLEQPRHVEIQVLFDADGRGVHLGERDCSLQRRHQKILEEAPAPGMTPPLRAALGEAALRLAAAVGYVGAGTCEFLLDEGGRFVFLEMNTRLQVEHPVTEAITGRDLVADQLRIAAGEPLGLDQAEVLRALEAGGHAVEVRLYAEDAEAGFLPATGRVVDVAWPTGEGIRVDAGVEVGAVVGGRFDPLLAKLIAHGPDRATALDRLAAALEETRVLGLVTNLRFLRWLVRAPVVRAGLARTDTLAVIWPPDDWAERVRRASGADRVWEAAAAALRRALAAEATATGDVWGDGWRPFGAALRLVADDGATRTVHLPSAGDARRAAGGAAEPEPGGPGEDRGPVVALDGLVAHVDVEGRSVAVRLAPPPDVDAAVRAAERGHSGGVQIIEAPMPGLVGAVHVAIGDRVAAGDPVVTLEAMKMEHVVAAPGPGRIVDVAVGRGDQLARGDVIAVLEP
jgi:acetyl-CoA/propionyl-CoA carboxylase biotin carboxyl carrier protein